MSKILVTRKIPYWDELSKPIFDGGHEVIFGKLDLLDGSFDGLLCLLTDKVDSAVLDRANGLKIIANYAVGYDNIDVATAASKNIMVTNTPCDEVSESVAEFSWTLILALARRLNEAGEYMRNAAYHGWEPDIFVGMDLASKTLGIIGKGRIGSRVESRAVGFGMKILNFERGGKLEEFLPQCDVITLHVPLTAETRHLINGKNLPLFKKGALLVNTARGPVVNEEEVAQSLRAGMIGGYGADVFENEPSPYAELLQMENVILTPHIASATVSARRAMGTIAVMNLVQGLSGQTPSNVIQVVK